MKSKLILCLAMILATLSLLAQSEQPDKKIMKPALLVVDVQNQFLPMMSKEDQEKALEMMNWSIYVFREYKLPVIRIYHTSEKWGPEPGTDEFQFPEILNIEESDPMVIKTYGSGFTKTNLDSLLKAREINTLFICGLSSLGCVMATYFDAQNYDYTAFLIKDAMLGPNAEYTDQVEVMFEAVDLNLVNYMMEIRAE